MWLKLAASSCVSGTVTGVPVKCEIALGTSSSSSDAMSRLTPSREQFVPANGGTEPR